LIQLSAGLPFMLHPDRDRRITARRVGHWCLVAAALVGAGAAMVLAGLRGLDGVVGAAPLVGALAGLPASFLAVRRRYRLRWFDVDRPWDWP
jgi:hypothetical protein